MAQLPVKSVQTAGHYEVESNIFAYNATKNLRPVTLGFHLIIGTDPASANDPFDQFPGNSTFDFNITISELGNLITVAQAGGVCTVNGQTFTFTPNSLNTGEFNSAFAKFNTSLQAWAIEVDGAIGGGSAASKAASFVAMLADMAETNSKVSQAIVDLLLDLEVIDLPRVTR